MRTEHVGGGGDLGRGEVSLPGAGRQPSPSELRTEDRREDGDIPTTGAPVLSTTSGTTGSRVDPRPGLVAPAWAEPIGRDKNGDLIYLGSDGRTWSGDQGEQYSPPATGSRASTDRRIRSARADSPPSLGTLNENYFSAETTRTALEGELGDQIKEKVADEVVSTVGATLLGKYVLDPSLAELEMLLTGQYKKLRASGLTHGDTMSIMDDWAKELARHARDGTLPDTKGVKAWLKRKALRFTTVGEGVLQVGGARRLAQSGVPKTVIGKRLGRRLAGSAGRAFLKGLLGKLLGPLGVISDLKTIGEAGYCGYKAYEARSGAEDQLRQAEDAETRLETARDDREVSQEDRLRDLVAREREYARRTGRPLPPATRRLAESLE